LINGIYEIDRKVGWNFRRIIHYSPNNPYNHLSNSYLKYPNKEHVVYTLILSTSPTSLFSISHLPSNHHLLWYLATNANCCWYVLSTTSIQTNPVNSQLLALVHNPITLWIHWIHCWLEYDWSNWRYWLDRGYW